MILIVFFPHSSSNSFDIVRPISIWIGTALLPVLMVIDECKFRTVRNSVQSYATPTK
jgi:hypothetical protein